MVGSWPGDIGRRRHSSRCGARERLVRGDWLRLRWIIWVSRGCPRRIPALQTVRESSSSDGDKGLPGVARLRRERYPKWSVFRGRVNAAQSNRLIDYVGLPRIR